MTSSNEKSGEDSFKSVLEMTPQELQASLEKSLEWFRKYVADVESKEKVKDVSKG